MKILSKDQQQQIIDCFDNPEEASDNLGLLVEFCLNPDNHKISNSFEFSSDDPFLKGVYFLEKIKGILKQ